MKNTFLISTASLKPKVKALAIFMAAISVFFNTLVLAVDEALSLENKDGAIVKAQIISLDGNEVTIRVIGRLKNYTIGLDSLNEVSQDLVRKRWQLMNPGEGVNVLDFIDYGGKGIAREFTHLENPDKDIFGCKIGDSGQSVINVLGKPSSLHAIDDNEFLMIYSKYFWFFFENNKLKSVEIKGTSLYRFPGSSNTYSKNSAFTFMKVITFGMSLEELEKHKFELRGSDTIKFFINMNHDVSLHLRSSSQIDGSKSFYLDKIVITK